MSGGGSSASKSHVTETVECETTHKGGGTTVYRITLYREAPQSTYKFISGTLTMHQMLGMQDLLPFELHIKEDRASLK